MTVQRRKSGRSNNGTCVEVPTNLPEVASIRDSKDPTGPVLVVPRDDFRVFVDSLKR